MSEDRTPLVGRRGLLGGLAGGAVGVTMAAGSAADATDVAEAPVASYPFEGAHQQGILTPLQEAAVFVSFDVVVTSKDELAGLLQDLTVAARLLTGGGTPPDPGLASTAVDSGVVGDVIVPDGLTLTFSVGASLFDHRYGLAERKPVRLRTMTAFPDDRLQPDRCGGDLLVQICAHHADTVLHAMRYLSRVASGRMVARWRQGGFTSPPRPAGTPRNLMGFKDGTANLDVTDARTMAALVWAGADEPAWAAGGTYHVVRLIRMLVEFWDRVNLPEQEKMIGRRKSSGAPLTGSREFDAPDFVHDPSGESIPTNAHIRLANPRLSSTDQSRILRRPYNYDADLDPNGQYDQGLVFVCFNQDLERQFVAIQDRLAGEPLVDYISPFGGGYFFALPGVTGASDWLGRGLLA